MGRRRRNPSGLFGLLGLIVVLGAYLLARRRPPGLAAKAPPSTGELAHVELGLPRDGDDSDDLLVRRRQYVLSYNPRRNVANWASWRLLAADLGGAPRRKGEFLEDPALPAGVLRVTHRDYSRSGFDRGHLVRSADRTASREDNDATFFMTNVVPQRHGLNEGAWLRLEEHCSELARRGKQLFVIAGPIFKDPAAGPTVGPGIRVPDALFKIVVVLEPGQGREDVRESTTVLAVAMPNADDAQPTWQAHRTTIDALEARTGYDFLDAVAPTVQASLESH